MSDWNLPGLTNNYPDFLTYLKARDVDAATLFSSVPTNPQEGFIRFLRASLVFQEYLSGAWTTRLLSLAGGGTGAANAADARTNLGLGGMALQNPNSISITGGSITGINFDAAVIASGNLNISRLPLGGTWALTSLLALSGHALHAKALGLNYRTGGPTTLTDTDGVYDCGGGVITLPDATTIIGRLYIIKRSGTTVTLDPFGSQTININGTTVTTYTGLGANQSLILQSDGANWIAIVMGGQVYKDNQFATVTMNAGVAIENQALPATVSEVKKALIFPLNALIRVVTGGITGPVGCHFADSAGNEITNGSATHLRVIGGDSNSPTSLFRFIIQEWQ